MKKLECEGACDLFGGCHGDVRTVVVSRVGERNLCSAAVAAYEVGGYIVSEVYPKYSDNDSRRPIVSEDILRNLGHGLREDV